MARVLLVEDDDDFAFALATLLCGAGHTVEVSQRADAAITSVREGTEPFDVALVDLGLPDSDGLTLIEGLAAADAVLPVICVTGRAEASHVVEAMRRGAVDYLTKPASRADVLAAIESATATSRARRGASRRLGERGPAVVGTSPAWQKAMDLVAAAAAAPRTSVLFTGEPGVGKEVAATLLHAWSNRAKKPFVTANAACFSPGLVESELFGHEAGAFTGAAKRRRGLFEQADGGILFLDEIGELSLDLQSKLLRVLENHPFRRVGGEEQVQVDVRLVTATNRDLKTLVAEGRFRADLYERIRVFEVALPRLCERRSDIPSLAQHFLLRLSGELGPKHPLPIITDDAMALLQAHRWPGNVRELRNAIERAVVLAGGGPILKHHLPEHLGAAPDDGPAPTEPRAPEDARIETLTRAHIEAVFHETGGNVTQTAARLGLSRLTVRKRLQAWGLRPVKP